MTFEELQTISIDQNRRIFNITCNFQYAATSEFLRHHARFMQLSGIYDSSLYALDKIKFPYENIALAIEFVHCSVKTEGFEKFITGVSFQFSLFILNLPSTHFNDFRLLMRKFNTSFDCCLTEYEGVPLQIRSNSIQIIMDKRHSLYKAVSSNFFKS